MPEAAIPPLHFAYGLITLAVFLVLHFLMRNRWERSIRSWCVEHGYLLVSWQSARFYEGPRRSDNQESFRIEVEDRDGILRDGYLTFGTAWGLTRRRVEVEWDG